MSPPGTGRTRELAGRLVMAVILGAVALWSISILLGAAASVLTGRS